MTIARSIWSAAHSACAFSSSACSTARKKCALGTLTAPGTIGSNGAFMAGTPVSDSAPIVTPWYAHCRLMTL